METIRKPGPLPEPVETLSLGALRARRPRGERGVAAVEFAMLLPMLMFLVLATMQMAEAFYLRKLLLGAAHSAARIGVSQTSTVSDATAAVDTYLANTRIAGAYETAISGVGPGMGGDSLVIVTVHYHFPLFATLPAIGWTDATVPLTASVTLRHE